MLIALMTWNGHGGYGPGGWGPGGWDPGGWWPIFPLAWLLLLGAVVATFVVLWRRKWTPYQADPTATAKAQLAERFARSEIGEQEYHERLAVLRQDSGGRDK